MSFEMLFRYALPGSSIDSEIGRCWVICDGIHTESTSHILILASSDADARNTPSGGPSDVGVPSCMAIQVTDENADEKDFIF